MVSYFFENCLFYVFATFALISAYMVIFAKNPIYSVLFLVLVFFNSVAILILMNAEFLGMIFMIVYVGAIAILFLFVVMMLNLKTNELNENYLIMFLMQIFNAHLFLNLISCIEIILIDFSLSHQNYYYLHYYLHYY